jgi:site-specific recombinase XerC
MGYGSMKKAGALAPRLSARPGACVCLALAGVDPFNGFLGLGSADLKRDARGLAAPRALAEEEQRALLRAAQTSRTRGRAMVTLVLYSTLRLHELAALDVDGEALGRPSPRTVLHRRRGPKTQGQLLGAVEFGHVDVVVRGHGGVGYERRSNSGGCVERAANGLRRGGC